MSSTSSSTLTPANTSVNDGRERVVRNRLRWLEGNWDGRLPPPKSDPPPAGEEKACMSHAKHCCYHTRHHPVLGSRFWACYDRRTSTLLLLHACYLLRIIKLCIQQAYTVYYSCIHWKHYILDTQASTVLEPVLAIARYDTDHRLHAPTAVTSRSVPTMPVSRYLFPLPIHAIGSQSASRRRRVNHRYGERDTRLGESQAPACTSPGTQSMAMGQGSGGCLSLQQFVEADNAEKIANAKGLMGNTFREDSEGDSPTSASNRVGDYFFRSGSDGNGTRLFPPCLPPEGLRRDRSPVQKPTSRTEDDIALLEDNDDASSQLNHQDDAYDSAHMLDDLTCDLSSRGDATTTRAVQRVNGAMSYDENFSSKSHTTIDTTTVVGRYDDVDGSAPQQQHPFVKVANERTRRLGALKAESELVVQRPRQASFGNNNNLIPAVATKGEVSEHDARYSNRARAPFAEPLSEISVAASGFEFDGHAPTSETPPSSEIARRDDVGTALDRPGEVVRFREEAQRPHADSSSRRNDASRFDEDGDRVRWLLEEVKSLKEELTRTQIRQAAAEATAASVLQRARAAELSRDVKEIQV